MTSVAQSLTKRLLKLKSRRPMLFRTCKSIITWVMWGPSLALTSAIKIVDLLVPKSPDIWIFPVHFFLRTFSDNSRAVYEAAQAYTHVKKIILVRDRSIDTQQREDTLIVDMLSAKAVWYLFRAKVIIIQHSLYLDLSPLRIQGRFFFAISRRVIFNTWHGIPIKSLLANSSGMHIPSIRREKKHYHLCASSKIDQLAMTVSFYPIPPPRVYVTGAPRNDFLVAVEDCLPGYCREQLAHIRSLKRGRKLLVYAPTYRELQLGGQYYDFSSQEIESLKALLRAHDAVLGIRLHYFNRQISYSEFIDGDIVVDLDQSHVPDMAMILRESHIIITDYSGLFVDALYLKRPAISFAYDREHYMRSQRGFVYDLNMISPLPVCETFDELMTLVATLLPRPSHLSMQECGYAQKMFFDHIDANNGRRAIAKIDALTH